MANCQVTPIVRLESQRELLSIEMSNYWNLKCLKNFKYWQHCNAKLVTLHSILAQLTDVHYFTCTRFERKQFYQEMNRFS